MVNDLIKRPGTALARPSVKGGGLALINKTLANYAEPLAMLRVCADQNRVSVYLGDDDDDIPASLCDGAKFCDRATTVLNASLPYYAKMLTTRWMLYEVLELPQTGMRPKPITQPAALKMLGVLFGALSKRKDGDENAAALLMACADMFDPTSEFVGNATGLWEPVSKHPVILALTIKHLLATEKWAPAPSELRAEMILVKTRLNNSLGYGVENWLARVERADEIVFTFDREAWLRAYTRVHSSVPDAMRKLGSCIGGEPGMDDDGNSIPASPHWQALDDLVQRKRKVEALKAESKPKIAAAACKKAITKRTQKPKGDEDGKSSE